MAATATTTDLDWNSADAAGLARPLAGRPAGARLLELDPDLGRRLSREQHDRLTPHLRVGVRTYQCGAWEPGRLGTGPATLGLLVLDGLLLRELSLDGRCCAEVLGQGDVLRPWPDPDGPVDPSANAELAWEVVDGPLRVAVIDHRATLLIGRSPDLMAELLDRTLSRARALQFQLALSQVHGIERRLELLLWHFADRWGRVTLDGIVLPLNLTHEMLGRLIGARRPSVTTALRRLHDAGTVVRTGEGWLLRHDPLGGEVVPLVSGR